MMFIEEQIEDLKKKLQLLEAMVSKMDCSIPWPSPIRGGMVFMKYDGSMWLSVYPSEGKFCLVCLKTGQTFAHLEGFGGKESYFTFVGLSESFSVVRTLGSLT